DGTRVSSAPYATIDAGRATLRFFHGDCLAILPELRGGSLAAIVPSPPYNLGIRYRSYADTLPRDRYLRWTSAWIGAARVAMAEDASLFLNVGAKPTDPWAALEVAQAA